MDTKRVNIYAGSILGALLLFLLLTFFSNLIYHGPENAGEEEELLAYAVEVEEPTGGGAEEPEEVDLAALAAEADPDAGEKVFNKCQACHSLEQGDHGVGPSLHNVVGSDIASTEGFSYSDALTSLEGAWDLETLSAFLEDPQGYASGTKMGFAGLDDPEDRVNVIAYLNQASDSPVELAPEDTETAAAETETDAGDAAAEGEDAAGEEGEQQAAAEEDEAAQDTEPAADEAAPGDAGDGEYAELLANASAENGEKVYRKCQACHTLEEGSHRVGPSLHGVVGREAGSAEGFNYSDTMAEFGEDWTLANLDSYLANPNDFLPGNKMPFPGLDDAQDRIDVITYIDQSDGERDLPKAGAAEAEGEQQAAEGEQQAGQGEQQPAEDEQQATAGGEYAELLANASAEEGKKVYRKCQACHTLDEGKHRVGPSLYGVIGSEAAAAEGFNYSDALKAFDEKWTLSNLDAFLENPNDFIPGNRMPFPGLKDPQDRINVLIYIDESDGERDLPQ